MIDMSCNIYTNSINVKLKINYYTLMGIIMHKMIYFIPFKETLKPNKMKNLSIPALFIYLFVIATILTGEVKCIIKAVNCDWNPIGKAEIVYTGAALTGLGVIVGYMDIQDTK